MNESNNGGNNQPNFQETCFTESPPPTSEKWQRLELNNENDYATRLDSEVNPFETFKLCLLTFDTKVYSTSIFNLTVLKFYMQIRTRIIRFQQIESVSVWYGRDKKTDK